MWKDLGTFKFNGLYIICCFVYFVYMSLKEYKLKKSDVNSDIRNIWKKDNKSILKYDDLSFL